ncbi:MAG: HTTM domain-containing protein [Candidatus Obscuribacterales bacterium]|nr:HTTM domain-containing protein [Candidatus Obscuribacterales bacterium]
MILAEIGKFWEACWFGKTSGRPLAIFRILIGALIALSLLMLLPEVPNFYGPKGIASIQTVQAWEGAHARFSLLFFMPPTDSSAYLLLALALLFSFLVSAGLFTRASLIALFVLLVSLHHRNPMILNSADTIFRLFLFLLIFSDCSKILSVDAWIRKKRNPGAPVDDLVSAWPINLLKLQIAAVYCQTFWAKLQGPTWWDGTAVYYALRLEEFYRFAEPVDQLWFYKLSTWAGLAIELSLWTLIWIREFRYWVLLAAVALHLGIEYTMNIPLFEYVMLVSFILFIYPEDLERAIVLTKQKLASRAKTR